MSSPPGHPIVSVESDRRSAVLALVVAWAGLVFSGVGPNDRFTWILEVAPVLIVTPIVILTRRRFPLTPLLMVLVAFHALVLELGGHYEYARVPLGDWMRHAFGFARNHYDRLGHFTQGFVPAIAVREILLRRTPLRRGGWLSFLVSAVCLAISATYEFVEWFTALATGDSATAFLGTQGDPWDTQWDMLMALIGSVVAQLAFARMHDAQLARRGLVAPDTEAVSSVPGGASPRDRSSS